MLRNIYEIDIQQRPLIKLNYVICNYNSKDFITFKTQIVNATHVM